MSHRRRMSGRGRLGRAVGWWTLSAALTLVGANILVLGGGHSDHGGAAAPTAPTAYPAATGPPRLPVSPPPRARRDLQPVSLRIPALNVSTTLTTLALQPDRTVEVPADPDQAGWFRLGPPPGALGSSVILGHVDSAAGPAVFARLRDLVPGDPIDVRRADGVTIEFAVTDVRTYLHASFPAHRIYAANGHRDLNLITCGGSYDRANGGYQANVVAYTHRVATHRSGAPPRA